MPRGDKEMQEEPLYIRNESKGTLVKEPQDFINGILPYDLAQFFMFDGEGWINTDCCSRTLTM